MLQRGGGRGSRLINKSFNFSYAGNDHDLQTSLTIENMDRSNGRGGFACASALDALTAARDAGLDRGVELRIDRHDVDTTGWVDPAVLVNRPYQD
ncbi:hypothetical protein [Amycolatopsis sp. SID8362]|uniref:hypothetical protein n=1 Tax=Amycolatopsis sp. SID8362 TaxID=2690346 RepID=UPI0013D14EEC|nr:hypothetical protein [Amycolatopsis sp. SID8362]NED40222.1 hypothetical protein [Amycolatopsis sp. SID8362]NED41326.1 hypothetical protein [Amycolatopsis sp. SID8362]